MTAPMQPMLARRQLRLAAVGALTPLQTSAQIATLDTPGDWATPPEKLPAVLLRTGRGRKDSINKGMAEFNTTIILEIEARVEAITAQAAQDAIEALAYAIENALYTDYNVIGMVQQVVSVDEEIEITSEGKRHLGGIKMAITFEMVEIFDPTATPPALTTWPVVPPATVSMTSMGIHFDMMGTFDANGTYTPPVDSPPYTPVPAPRTTGPDGRDEAALNLTLT
jgi:hypothetical protein